MRQHCSKRFLILSLHAIVAALLWSSFSGCNRSYYRRQADADAKRLIAEKSKNPYWGIEDFSIKPDPRSRLEDPFSADFPPLPPDDPASHQFMEKVDGKPGYPRWHANGDALTVENPDWYSYLVVNEKGQLKLNMADAFRLALVESRLYQRQKEELYLSALDVSLERFSFETQFFAPFQQTFEHVGANRGGGDSQTNVLLGNNGLGNRITKAGIAGSQLVVNLANSIVWQLSGPNSTTWNNSLGFELVQPLLRGAGRDRVLAALTESERTLLGNVRQMERFRRGFYLLIVAGSNTGGGPSRAGAFLDIAAGGSTGAGGYIGLLRAQQDIRIQEANVASQRSLLSLFEEFAAANRISLLQLQQFRTSLYNAQSRLLIARNRYQSDLDEFKILLGLPPELDIIIEDPMLDDFILLDENILKRQSDLTALQESMGEVIVRFLTSKAFIAAGIDDPIDGAEEDEFKWSDELENGLESLFDSLGEAELIRQQIEQTDLPRSEKDIERFKASIAGRKSTLEKLRIQTRKLYDPNSNVPVIEPKILDPSDMLETEKVIRSSLGNIVKRFQKMKPLIKSRRAEILTLLKDGKDLSGKELRNALKSKVSDPVPEIVTELSGIVSEISLVQASARNDTVMLKEIDITAKQAVEIARVYRRDWMNARSALVDIWRNIEFVADDLESQLDLTFAGDVQNDNEPFNFDFSNGRILAGIEFDAPITRLSERNQYRAALIEYQRARRNYMLFEDNVSLTLRLIVRTLEQNKLDFEIQRQSVKVAVQQLELARFQLEEPPKPNQQASRLGSTTARDLVDALNGLQNAQNSLLSLYVDYEVLRRNLDFQMGTMQLDCDGYWIDPGPITEERAIEITPPYGEHPIIFKDSSAEQLEDLPPAEPVEPEDPKVEQENSEPKETELHPPANLENSKEERTMDIELPSSRIKRLANLVNQRRQQMKGREPNETQRKFR